MAYFCFANIYQEKPDDPTKLLGWKVSICEILNGALDTLFHHSTDNHLITEEKGMTLTFLGILFSVKMLLEMN